MIPPPMKQLKKWWISPWWMSRPEMVLPPVILLSPVRSKVDNGQWVTNLVAWKCCCIPLSVLNLVHVNFS